MTPLNIKYKTILSHYGLNTPLRLAHFFSQLEHESGLKPISENLNYSEKGLLKTFKKYFTPEQAKQYANKPIQIASRVYGNRMGNGSEESMEGFKFRGRGFIQLTGKNNYILLSKDTRIDFINNPDMLLQEANAMIGALWFWNVNKLNAIADKDDCILLTKKINGGKNGLKHRQELLIKWKEKLQY